MKGALMKRTIPLLATTMTLAVLVFGGVAVSQQRQELSTSSHSSTASDKSSGDVSIQSTKVKASFASGTGADFLGVKVSNHGNLLSFESPAGQEAVFTGREGYALCSQGGGVVRGHDTGGVEAGFGPPKFKQPNPGKFPLTITRNTTDGNFQLKQVWSKPDATEKDVTLTMTVKNISNSALGVLLSRSGDFDVGSNVNDQGARTDDSVWQWDDSSSATVETFRGGTMLTGLTTSGSEHAARIEQSSAWAV